LAARKNILFLTHRVPFPPNKGDKIRTFHQIEYLSRWHDVYCACFVDDQADWAHMEPLRRWCVRIAAFPWRKRTGLGRAALRGSSRQPLTRIVYQDRRMRGLLAAWSRELAFDVVIACSSSMAGYALDIPAKRRVLDLCDVDSEKWRAYADRSGPLSAWIYRREAGLLREFEEACVHAFDVMILATRRERAVLDPRERWGNIHIVGNGVRHPFGQHRAASACDPVIGFIGAMDYRPNVEGIRWFVEHAWPTVKEEIPAARLRIVGRNPTPQVRRLARRDGIMVTGEVPDVVRHIAECRAMIAPMQIVRGVPNKVLEAMALGRPVVATSAVASCLSLESGVNILVADDEAAFARSTVEICSDLDLCERIGRTAMDHVRQHCNWDDVLRSFADAVLPSSSRPMRRRCSETHYARRRTREHQLCAASHHCAGSSH